MSLINGVSWPIALCVCASLIGLTGCGSPPSDSPVTISPVDMAAARESLLEQDLRFAEAVQTDGVAEAYRRFMAEDAVQLPDGGLAVGGRDEIYMELRAVTTGQNFSLTWEPLDAQVAESGELGFTWGIYYYDSVDELGAPYTAEGKYVYVWRKNNDRWELILDITNQTEPIYSDEESDYDDYDEWDEEAGLDEVVPHGGAASPDGTPASNNAL